MNPPEHVGFFENFPSLPILAIIVVVSFLKSRRSDDHSFKQSMVELIQILPLLLAIFLYPIVPRIIHFLMRPDQDQALYAIDRSLFGGADPHAWLATFNTPIVCEWMALSYVSYGFFFFLTFGWIYLGKSSASIKKFVFEMTLTITAGYLGYLLVPAIGPLHTLTYAEPLNLTFFKTLKEVTMDQTRIERDCFPSLHTAVGLILGRHLYFNFRRTFWASLPLIISIPFSCVFLRYHYVIDVIAGLALVIFVIAISSMKSKKLKNKRVSFTTQN